MPYNVKRDAWRKQMGARRSVKNVTRDVPEEKRETVPATPKKVRVKAPVVTPMTRWARHLDGADEHRCATCYIAFPEGQDLCDAGQALYAASHPETRQG